MKGGKFGPASAVDAQSSEMPGYPSTLGQARRSSSMQMQLKLRGHNANSH